jgi:hypothetical protein
LDLSFFGARLDAAGLSEQSQSVQRSLVQLTWKMRSWQLEIYILRSVARYAALRAPELIYYFKINVAAANVHGLSSESIQIVLEHTIYYSIVQLQNYVLMRLDGAKSDCGKVNFFNRAMFLSI